MGLSRRDCRQIQLINAVRELPAPRNIEQVEEVIDRLAVAIATAGVSSVGEESANMEPVIVTYVLDGDTFVGHFATKGQGEAALLTVWYKHVHASAQVIGLRPEVVAKVLLGELVRDDLANAPKPVGTTGRRDRGLTPLPETMTVMTLRTLACGVCILAPLGSAGCMPDISIPKSIPHFSSKDDRPGNLVERALNGCGDKTVAAETLCVRKALDGASLSVAGLTALVPHCSLGRICTYDYTTEDRIGFIPAYATRPVYQWRVTFDLTKKPKAIADVPITVEVL